MFNLTSWGIGLLKTPSERDLQTRVGASDLSNQCTRCLADALLALKSDAMQSDFWLAPRIGTGIHLLIEQRAPEHGAIGEHRVVLGELPGYGPVKSTLDLYITDENMVVDAKSTTRKKLAAYKRVLLEDDPSESLIPHRLTVNTYLNQLMLYGKGAQDEGYTVESVGILFICRDGAADNDVWGWPVPFDRQRADAVWARAANLWAWLDLGHDPDELNRAPGCYTCTHLRPKASRGKLYLNLEEGA